MYGNRLFSKINQPLEQAQTAHLPNFYCNLSGLVVVDNRPAIDDFHAASRRIYATC